MCKYVHCPKSIVLNLGLAYARLAWPTRLDKIS
jgi:hypothetical protein